jgi:hypothetical protein
MLKQHYEAPEAELFLVRFEDNIMSDPQVSVDMSREDYEYQEL